MNDIILEFHIQIIDEDLPFLLSLSDMTPVNHLRKQPREPAGAQSISRERIDQAIIRRSIHPWWRNAVDLLLVHGAQAPTQTVRSPARGQIVKAPKASGSR